MTKVYANKIENEVVKISGDLSNTHFCECTLDYSGGDATLKNCFIQRCQYQLSGVAGEGLEFLQTLYNQGEKKQVLGAFLNDEELEKVATALGWDEECK